MLFYPLKSDQNVKEQLDSLSKIYANRLESIGTDIKIISNELIGNYREYPASQFEIIWKLHGKFLISTIVHAIAKENKVILLGGHTAYDTGELLDIFETIDLNPWFRNRRITYPRQRDKALQRYNYLVILWKQRYRSQTLLLLMPTSWQKAWNVPKRALYAGCGQTYNGLPIYRGKKNWPNPWFWKFNHRNRAIKRARRFHLRRGMVMLLRWSTLDETWLDSGRNLPGLFSFPSNVS